MKKEMLEKDLRKRIRKSEWTLGLAMLFGAVLSFAIVILCQNLIAKFPYTEETIADIRITGFLLLWVLLILPCRWLISYISAKVIRG